MCYPINQTIAILLLFFLFQPTWIAGRKPSNVQQHQPSQQQQRKPFFANSANRNNYNSNQSTAQLNSQANRAQSQNYQNYNQWNRPTPPQQQPTNTYTATFPNQQSQANARSNTNQTPISAKPTQTQSWYPHQNKWLNDLYDGIKNDTNVNRNTQNRNASTGLTPKPPVNTNASNRNVNVVPKIADSKINETFGISSSWLTSANDAAKKSVFDRLGSKVNATEQNNRTSVQSRLNVNVTTTAKPSDTVDFVSSEPNLNNVTQQVSETISDEKAISNQLESKVKIRDESLDRSNTLRNLLILKKLERLTSNPMMNAVKDNPLVFTFFLRV